MFKRFSKTLICILVAMVLSANIAQPCFAEVNAAESEKVTVAVIDYPNYIIMKEDGTVFGYAYEYLLEIQKYTGWEYDFQEMSFAEATVKLAENEIDLLAGNQYTDERAELWDYSKRDMGEGGSVLCTLSNSDKYAYNDYKSYDGIIIGALESSNRIEQTREILAGYGVEAVFKEYETDEESKTALKNGEVEAILMSTIRCETGYKIIARINSTPLYFCTNKNRPELKTELGEAMEKIHLDSPYYEENLNQKYYGNIKVQTALTADELEYVSTVGTITIALSTDMAPIEYYDEKTDTYLGVIPDALDAISETIGIKFKCVPRKSSETIVSQIKNDEIQMLGGVVSDLNVSASLGVTTTSSFYTNGFSLVMRDGSKADLDDLMVIKKGYPLFTEVAKQNGYTNIKYLDSFDECLQAVKTGKATFTLLTSISSNLDLSHSYYKNLNSYLLPNSNYDFGLGVSDYTDARLLSILNKAISSFSEEQKSQFLVSNISKVANKTNFRDFLSNNVVAIVLIIFLIAAFILLAVTLNTIKIKKLNARLKAEAIRADQSSTAKSDFLSQMSHDIRTPLNAVLGFSNLASEEPNLSDNVADYLQKIQSSGKYLLSLINDILDMSKIESGKIKLNEESVNFPKFLNELAETFKSCAEEKEIKLITDFSEIQNKWIILDELRIHQIFANLLSNAIKFSQNGTEIRWTVREGLIGPDTVHIISSISDQGCGISTEDQERIFEPFEQADSKKHIQGTGLGLSIVRSMLQLMGGEIRVSSELNKGSTFTFELDRKTGEPQQETETISKHDNTTLFGMKILLCEDNRINILVARKILEKFNCIITVAENGKIGLETFENSKIGYYDAILMDIRMPIMDGLEAAKAIRDLDRADAKTVPIIAMSANAFDEDVKKSLDAGMNRHLSKPVDAKLLNDTLSELINKE